MATDITIIRNAPPPPEVGARHKWPFDKLEVGDAFDAPILKRANLSYTASQRKIRKGELYTIRKIDDQTVRVWRLA